MPTIIDGDEIAHEIKEFLKITTAHLTKFGARAPMLVVIMIGEDQNSYSNILEKQRVCNETGVLCEIIAMDFDVTEEDLIRQISILNNAHEVDAIYIQFPLPEHIIEENIKRSINPMKDVDCIHTNNLREFMMNKPDMTKDSLGLVPHAPRLLPCTPLGIIHLLDSIGVNLQCRHAAIICKSYIEGAQLRQFLEYKGVKVTTYSAFEDFDRQLKEADIIISTACVKHLVDASLLRPHTIVIDAGVTYDADTRVYGDVKGCSESNVGWFTTPFPRSIPPVIAAMLAHNTISAYVACMIERNDRHAAETDGYELESARTDRGLYPAFNLNSMQNSPILSRKYLENNPYKREIENLDELCLDALFQPGSVSKYTV